MWCNNSPCSKECLAGKRGEKGSGRYSTYPSTFQLSVYPHFCAFIVSRHFPWRMTIAKEIAHVYSSSNQVYAADATSQQSIYTTRSQSFTAIKHFQLKIVMYLKWLFRIRSFTIFTLQQKIKIKN